MIDSLLLLSIVSLPGCKIVVLEEERIVQVESIDIVLKWNNLDKAQQIDKEKENIF